MASNVPITVAYGDGIGPEIMPAVLHVLKEAGAQLDLQTIEIGEKVYKRGNTSGIEKSAWDSLRSTKVFLKAPITTPQGGGYKSLNVTTRKTLGLFANVRPCVSYYPFVRTKHPKMDVVIVRENEEDTYGGIEHQQTDEVIQCLKLISKPGCEKIVRYAFDYARRNGRKKVTCFSKDNIMKLTDGLFHKTFDAVAKEYPDVATDHLIIDIGAARLADKPDRFDVIVTLNLYGDIISDIAAEVAGSVGLAGSANIGDHCAMFEAIHGSAPDIAGKNIANPSGLLQAAVMMLVHINQADVATRIHNAWLATLEDGLHTADIFAAEMSQELMGTKQFAEAVVARLGKYPSILTPVCYAADQPRQPVAQAGETVRGVKQLVGVDLFVHWNESGRDPNVLGRKLEALNGDGLMLRMVTNRGVKVYPEGMPETFCTDHWRCRFAANPPEAPKAIVTVTHQQVIALLQRAAAAGFDFIKTENLYAFDGNRAYSLGQGE